MVFFKKLYPLISALYNIRPDILLFLVTSWVIRVLVLPRISLIILFLIYYLYVKTLRRKIINYDFVKNFFPVT
jgi:hypothetical protein